MTFLRIFYFWAAVGTLFTDVATAQEAAKHLFLDDAIETLDYDFARHPPHFRAGAVQLDDIPRPFNDPEFSWAAGYIWSHPLGNGRLPMPLPRSHFPAWTSNGTMESSPNGDMITQVLGPERSPLRWGDTLDLTARQMPAELLGTIGPQDPKQYLGATINSFPHSQQYGVFAVLAKMPPGKGIWPKFVLLPADKSWPPSIGIMHMLGESPSKFYVSLQTSTPENGVSYNAEHDAGIDLTSDFHEYAVDWGPEKVSWYFDRQLVYSVSTPKDLRKPCYLLANIAVGSAKDWGGAPDATTKFPVAMQIKSIKVWQRPEYRDRLSLQ